MKFYEVLMVEYDACESCGVEYYEGMTANDTIVAFANAHNDDDGYQCWLTDCETDEELATFTVEGEWVEIEWA